MPTPADDHAALLRALFAIYEAEAIDLVARRLPGVILVTERTASIGRIRTLARQVAEAWLAEREALGFPLLAEPQRPRGLVWLAGGGKAPSGGRA